MITACGLRNEDSCFFRDNIPDYLYWECPNGDFLNDFIYNQHAWIWIVWLLSQTWICIHIFMPRCERLAPTEKLFVHPMYNSLLIDQSLALNRRRDDEGKKILFLFIGQLYELYRFYRCLSIFGLFGSFWVEYLSNFCRFFNRYLNFVNFSRLVNFRYYCRICQFIPISSILHVFIFR